MNLAFRTLSVAATALLLQGCYTHTVVQIGDVPVGARVRARISAVEAELLQPVLGREDRVLDGSLVSRGADTLLLQVPSVMGTGERSLNQRVALPAQSILELEVRRLDRTRTAGLVAAVVAAGGFVLAQQMGSDARNDSPEPSPPVVDQTVFFLRWWW